MKGLTVLILYRIRNLTFFNCQVSDEVSALPQNFIKLFTMQRAVEAGKGIAHVVFGLPSFSAAVGITINKIAAAKS
jgi:hypothetical protein